MKVNGKIILSPETLEICHRLPWKRQEPAPAPIPAAGLLLTPELYAYLKATKPIVNRRPTKEELESGRNFLIEYLENERVTA